MRSFVLTTCLFLAAAAGPSPNAKGSSPNTKGSCDCSKAETEVSSLKKQLQKAQADVKKLKGELEASKSSQKELKECNDARTEELSVIAALTRTGSIGVDVIQHLLDQTTLDDKVADVLSGHVGTAKNITVSLVGKVAEVDYSSYVDKVKGHSLYVTYVNPTVTKVTEGAQPYIKQYINPAFETTKVYSEPAIAMAKKVYGTTAEVAEAHVLPMLSQGGGKAVSELPRLFGMAQAMLGSLLEPLFTITARAAPRHAKALPKGPMDQLLMVIFMVIALYFLLRVALVAMRLSIKTALRVSLLCFKLAVALPLAILRKLASYVLWFATGFYCCGLCKRKVAKSTTKLTKPTAQADKKPGTAFTNGVSKPASPPTKLTVKELEKLLEASKKNGKLNEAAKMLAGMASSGKPLSGKSIPEFATGKLMDKDLLKKTLGKYKEVDIKKLGL